MSIRYCSEYGEDAFIDSLGILPDKGFYLDVGCAWPFLYSNTAFLRERGWDGACIDGNASYERSWGGVAAFTHCVIGDGQPIAFESNGVPELSRVGSGEIVPTRRLDDLLEFSPHVDLISCDIEGHEFEALKTFDWEKNQPLVIVAEYNTAGIGEDYRVKEMLEAMGYRERHRTVANIIFTL